MSEQTQLSRVPKPARPDLPVQNQLEMQTTSIGLYLKPNFVEVFLRCPSICSHITYTHKQAHPSKSKQKHKYGIEM